MILTFWRAAIFHPCKPRASGDDPDFIWLTGGGEV